MHAGHMVHRHHQILKIAVVLVACIPLAGSPAYANSVTNFFKRLSTLGKETPKPHVPEVPAHAPEIAHPRPIDAQPQSGSSYYVPRINGTKQLIEKIETECRKLSKGDEVMIVSSVDERQENSESNRAPWLFAPWLSLEPPKTSGEVIYTVTDVQIIRDACLAYLASEEGTTLSIKSGDIVYRLSPATITQAPR